MATLRVHDSTEYWKKTDLMVKPASYPMAAGYDVPSVDTIHRPLTLDLSMNYAKNIISIIMH